MKIGNPLSFKDIRRYLLPGDTWVEVILSRGFCLGFLEGVLEESTKWSGTGTKTTRILEVHVTLVGATLEWKSFPLRVFFCTIPARILRSMYSSKSMEGFRSPTCNCDRFTTPPTHKDDQACSRVCHGVKCI